jgi:Zn-dependent protease
MDYSWFLAFGLIMWNLAVGYYPAEYQNRSSAEYWVMGAASAALLFVCVVLHELGHSVLARRFKIPVNRITLFMFGGVSQLGGEPRTAGAEFLIAVAGPAVSIVLAGVFWGLQAALAGAASLAAVAKYLGLLNLILAIFNLIPGFPLDGGRVFRAIVWSVNRNFHRATLIAAVTGRFFGFLFILAGVWQALAGNLGGLWIAFIGWFLESAAASQIQQQTVKDLLAGHTVAEAMSRECPRIPGETTLQDLVDEQILAGGRRCFVVTRGEEMTGLVTLSDIRKTPRAAWPATAVGQVMVPREKLAWIAADAELWTAAEKMGRDGVNQLPVMENGVMVGMLSRDDLLHFLGILRELKA